MKIKVKNLKWLQKLSNDNLSIEEAEFEVTMKEFIEFLDSKDQKEVHIIPPMPVQQKQTKVFLYRKRNIKTFLDTYLGIVKGDRISVLPSEDCVTNRDLIKYDERLSGEKGYVLGIYEDKIYGWCVAIQLDKYGAEFYVHHTWLRGEERRKING